MKVQIDIFCRVVAGYIWEGKVLANIWFFDLGYISGIKALSFAQDLKLGIYSNVSIELRMEALLEAKLTERRSHQGTFSLSRLLAWSWGHWAKSRS